MLELAGVRPPDGLRFDGVSLAPLMLEGETLGPRQLFWNGAAMRDGPWKLVVSAPGLKNGPGLYNLDDDIGEQNNLAAENPDRVRAMLAAIEVWKKDVGE